MKQIKLDSGPVFSPFYKSNFSTERQENLKKINFKEKNFKKKGFLDDEQAWLNFYWARTPHNPYSIYTCGD